MERIIGGDRPPNAPAIAETHVSTVFFTADRAYKLLKPLRTSFLDHRSPASRIAATGEELRLNRRLAPDVYLGLAAVEERGSVVDQMLVMRRLPADRRLSTLLQDGPQDDCLRAVARRIAAFHAAQLPLPDADAIAGAPAVRRNWIDNLADIRTVADPRVPGTLVDDIEALATSYLDHGDDLFASRLAQGWVRDGHGDLTAQDIFCLDDGPRIIDCLAFAERLRIGDVLLDVAFLAMDTDRLAGPDAAGQLWRYYAEFSGEHHPVSLADHYVAYRAGVRAKVAALRHQQGDLAALPRMLAYLQQCQRHLWAAQKRLVLVGGPPGTGKSTLANGLSDALGIPLLRSDVVRKELTGRSWRDRDLVEVDAGPYDGATTARTYEEVLARASTLLKSGTSVIIDASFADADQRDRAAALARSRGAVLSALRCEVDADVARDRVTARLAQDGDPSDAHPGVVAELHRRFEPWPEAIPVATDVPPEDSVTAAVQSLDVSRSPRPQ